jgi:hypothetical protein
MIARLRHKIVRTTALGVVDVRRCAWSTQFVSEEELLLSLSIVLVIFGAGNLAQLSEGSTTPSNKGFKMSEHDAEAEAIQHSADPPMVVSECIKNK